jgi:hypothetical protein
MEHVVFFPAHDGSPAFRRLASLEEAVRLVEHLRNAEGVDNVTVHALTEVPLAFKAYYRVEMPGDVVAEAPQVPVQAVGEAAEAVAEAPLVEGVPVPQLVADAPVPVAVPEQEQPAEPAKASLGFFSRG